MEIKYINPDCVPFYYDEKGKRFEKKYDKSKGDQLKGIAYLANGHLLPCCWCDSVAFLSDFHNNGMLDESLKLENNDDILDILESDVWKDWLQKVLHDPDNAPTICQFKCGVKDE
jgi:hypothetical protein